MIKHLKKYLYIYLLFSTIINVIVFGISHNTLWQGGALGSDALGYSQYAHNIVVGNGFNLDGAGFDAVREPGYPAFLSIIYTFFGLDNVRAVIVIQTIILALISYIAYLITRRFVEEYVAIITAFVLSVLPYYGYYAAEYMTELLFAFMLFLCVYISIKLFENQYNFKYQILCGLIFALTTLIRTQMLLFPIFFSVFMLFLYRNQLKKVLPSIATIFLVYLVPIIMWSGIVYANTGNFMVTKGRQEMLLHVRAVRSTLSYTELTIYAKEWFLRSATGGKPFSLVDTYDLKAIKNEYKKIAISNESIQAIKKEDIKTIIQNPGHYLFGNIIEYMKFLYIEHDYSDYINRYFRLSYYIFMYTLFLSGLWFIIKKRKNIGREMKVALDFMLLIIIYHITTLTFIETVPRFNTPLHGLYIMVGIIGLWIWYTDYVSRNVQRRLTK